MERSCYTCDQQAHQHKEKRSLTQTVNSNLMVSYCRDRQAETAETDSNARQVCAYTGGPPACSTAASRPQSSELSLDQRRPQPQTSALPHAHRPQQTPQTSEISQRDAAPCSHRQTTQDLVKKLRGLRHPTSSIYPNGPQATPSPTVIEHRTVKHMLWEGSYHEEL